MHNKNSVYTERNSPTPNPLGHIVFDFPERYNLYSTSEPDKLVASKQRPKKAFLKQISFMRFD